MRFISIVECMGSWFLFIAKFKNFLKCALILQISKYKVFILIKLPFCFSFPKSEPQIFCYAFDDLVSGSWPGKWALDLGQTRWVNSCLWHNDWRQGPASAFQPGVVVVREVSLWRQTLGKVRTRVTVLFSVVHSIFPL